jgi:hypothetical protein
MPAFFGSWTCIFLLYGLVSEKQPIFVFIIIISVENDVNPFIKKWQFNPNEAR